MTAENVLTDLRDKIVDMCAELGYELEKIDAEEPAATREDIQSAFTEISSQMMSITRSLDYLLFLKKKAEYDEV